jgi:hypothetical protein
VQTDNLELEKDKQITSLNQDLSDSKKAQQKLLETVNFFTKNKELIKDALELHCTEASFRSSELARPADMPDD